VADPSRAAAQCLDSFTSDVLRHGRTPGAELISLRTETGPAVAAQQLGLGDAGEFVHIKRLRTVDGEPVYLSDAYIPAAILPQLATDDISRRGLGQSL
jgi:GntR family transcriptional regulator